MRFLRFICFSLVTTCGVWMLPIQAHAQNLIISEIMYHPPSTNRLEEWFEVFNAGNDTLDLSGWKVSKGVSFAFATNTTLPPQGYLAVAAHGPTFSSQHPGVSNFVAGWAGTLSDDGETLQIQDALSNTVAQVSYAPEGDWAVRRIGVLDALGRQGWEWYAEHDGGGKSLELLNVAMPNESAHNWLSSAVTGGTPGRPNSTARTNIPPIITEVQHIPAVPKSTEPVTISARILDEHTNGLMVTLQWRLDGAGSFTTATMFDDGTHGDGLAGDGIFGAVVPAQADKAVIEFYLTARDLENNARTYPNVQPSGGARTANLAYQVDNSVYSGDQPVFRLIMTQAEFNYLSTQIWGSEPDSDALVNGTFINADGVMDNGTSTQVRYNCGFRNRGHGTRTAVPHNFHVAFPKDRLWKGRAGLNLNTHYTHSQELGSAVFRRLAMPIAESRPVQVRVNGGNLAKSGQEQFGSYAANEVVGADLVQRQFPLDDGGNLYRGIRDMIPGISADADLVWHGSSYNSYTNAYAKENNKVANDWSDLVHLIDVLNNTPDATYANAVNNVINVDEWMKYFAINTLLDNQEGSLASGSGDDFALYRGTNDTRFVLLPYDMDALLGRGLRTTTYADGLWRMTRVAAINRLMKRPEFAPLYFRHLKQLADTAFSSAQMDPLLDQLLAGYVSAPTIANMKAFNASHVAYVLGQIPTALSVQSPLPVSSGYPRSTTATTALSGSANAIETRTIRVNGALATYSAWEGRWTNNAVTLRPGINRVLVQAFGPTGAEVGCTNIDLWYDDSSVAAVGGAIAANTTWTAAGGPYNLSSSVTVNSGVTLTIEAGTTVYLGSGVNLTVANGGTLLAQGTAQAPIRFTRPPGSSATWGHVVINGGAGSPESRIAHAHFEFNGSSPCLQVSAGTVFFDHLTFGNTGVSYLHVDGASFVIQDCVFPTATAGFELTHGTGGIKSGGRGVFLRNFFGTTIGYNDIIDFTGGNRPGPILQVIDNVFTGASDDVLDLDGTDAWVEGNLFLHVHRNGSPDSASAISGGSDGGLTSEITVIGNLFYDVDQAATAKQGNFYTLLNNTVVHQTHVGSQDPYTAVVNPGEEGVTPGAGMYLEGNVIVDAEALTRNYNPGVSTLVFTNNLMPFAWAGLGGNNSTADPRLKYLPQLSETYFSSFEEAQVMRGWFSLLPGSPALGTGPNGRDQGGVIPLGASISGEPIGTNHLTSATLRVGPLRTGNGIPVTGWPSGSGYTHYRYRLDGGAWSGERPAPTPIALSGLANGPHHVDISGKRDAGYYQDDAVFGLDAVVTASRTWTVNTGSVPSNLPTVRLNEILAANSATLINAGKTPDLVELFNDGTSAVDLSGMGLTDNADLPYKFAFPTNTTLAAGAFLVLFADSDFAAPGTHLGFSLKQTGDDVSLHASAIHGGTLLDSVTFGIQITDVAIGRRTDGTWGLCRPTFGTNNLALATGNERALKINEWLADAQFVANNDFIELYNPDRLPTDLGGLFLSDAAGSPMRHPIAPLSFIAGGGFSRFIADGDPGQGADHLNFKLAPEAGVILLSATDLTPIDVVAYDSQRTDVSEGRSPNGSDLITRFAQPTSGGPNPGPAGLNAVTNITQTVRTLVNVTTTSWRWDNSGSDRGTAWRAPAFDDSTWSTGLGLFGRETTLAKYPYPFQTAIPSPSQTGGHITVYYRTHFSWNNSLTNFQLIATNYVDDGAVFYLNGTEVGRLRISANPVLYTSTASDQSNEGMPEVLTFPTNNLVVGDNVLAVEVHQHNSTSSDDVLGLSLAAIHFTTNIVSLSSGVPVVLNEVLSENHALTNHLGHTADFVELYNPTTNAVDLAELSLSNDPNNPRKWIFPTNTTLGPLAYKVVYFDDAAPVSPTNTGFGLSGRGDVVYFFNRPAGGGSLLDAIRFGLQTPDYAIGRVPNGTGNWTLALPSPAAANTPAGLGSVSALRLNEWMADPASGADWFEIYNTASEPVALGGLFLTDNLADKTQSPLAPLSFIGSGGNAFLQFIADNNASAGNDHVNFALKKSGEAIGLFSPVNVQLDAVSFGPQVTGVSQGRFPDGAGTVAAFATTASPGEANYLPLASAVVNEVLTHTEPPLEDAVELLNPTASPVQLGGWYLSNAKDNLKKYRIPDGTTLPAHGFLVFYETNFNTGPTAFTFNAAHGDRAILSQTDALGNLTGYRSEAEFGAAANGMSFGRYVTSVGPDFTTLSARTFGVDNPATVAQFRTGTGLPNASPFVGPVVINEIMYQPVNGLPPVENPDEEYVELLNLSGSVVPLFDPAFRTNTWRLRGAVDYEFPTNVTLAANSTALVVSFVPSDAVVVAAFRSKYGVPPNVPIFGPWNGQLGNAGESVELVRPDAPQAPPHLDAGYVPQILVDRVHYASTAPWPAATGNGFSLQRVTAPAYGNDPANWLAAAPTAGAANGTTNADTDDDGMDDSWELAYFRTLAHDGNGDFDGDGMTDLHEYLAGTDPGDPASALTFVSITAGDSVTLGINLSAGHTYTVQYRDSLGSGTWQTLTNLPPAAVSGPVFVTDATTGGNSTRFYRMVTPAVR